MKGTKLCGAFMGDPFKSVECTKFHFHLTKDKTGVELWAKTGVHIRYWSLGNNVQNVFSFPPLLNITQAEESGKLPGPSPWRPAMISVLFF